MTAETAATRELSIRWSSLDRNWHRIKPLSRAFPISTTRVPLYLFIITKIKWKPLWSQRLLLYRVVCACFCFKIVRELSREDKHWNRALDYVSAPQFFALSHHRLLPRSIERCAMFFCSLAFSREGNLRRLVQSNPLYRWAFTTISDQKRILKERWSLLYVNADTNMRIAGYPIGTTNKATPLPTRTSPSTVLLCRAEVWSLMVTWWHYTATS